MKNRIHSLVLLAATAGSLAVGGCSKKEAAAPIPPPPAAAGTFNWTEGGSAKTAILQNHTLQPGGAPGQYVLALYGVWKPDSSYFNIDAVNIVLANVQTAGTYSFGLNATSGVSVKAELRRNPTGCCAAVWGVGMGGLPGAGSVTLTTFDANTRKAAGTFTFVGRPQTNSAGLDNINVTDGSFNVTIP